MAVLQACKHSDAEGTISEFRGPGAALREIDSIYTGPCHCVGEPAALLLQADR